MLIGGLYVKNKQIVADYSEYLGPDWERTYEGHCSTVSNHVSWWDIIVHMSQTQVCFTAKAGTLKLPFIGAVSKMIGCLYFDRGSKDSKQQVMKQMEERFKLIEKGLYPPLIMNAEGGTTNGRYIIKFKKGAFVGNYPCKPVVLKYHSPHVDLEQCVMPIYMHIILSSMNIGGHVEYLEFPVFKPNEYFFKHHQREGEEQWETYARVIREIMAKGSGLKLSDASIEDKFEYKKVLFGKGMKGSATD